MRLLIVKTSSLGDVIHTLPAVTDALRAHPHLQCDWVVESAFSEIPLAHPGIHRVIPCQIRKWRRAPWEASNKTALKSFYQDLRETSYDVVLDAQGLIKSALVARLAKGPRWGLDFRSAREPLARCFYQQGVAVSWELHAIDRLRSLFAQTLGYAIPTTAIDYGLDPGRFTPTPLPPKTLVFVHGTTWVNKAWPETAWRTLIQQAGAAGYTVVLPWGNALEHARAARLAEGYAHASVLSALRLGQLASLLSQSAGVVAVDSGLGHLAAAVSVPTVSLYGPTDPARTGTRGGYQQHLAASLDCAPCLKRVCRYTEALTPPCFNSVTPMRVWHTLEQLMQKN